MNKLFKIAVFLCLGGIVVASSMAGAQSIRTPEGNMPMVHWAVLESTPGDMMAMAQIGGKTVAPQTAKAFFQKTESMFTSSHIVENLETKIPLSTKGFHSNVVTK